MNGTLSAVSGTIYLIKFHLAVSDTVTKLFYYAGSAGVSPVTGQNFVGIYDTTGVRLAQTNIDSVVINSGIIQATLSPQFVSIPWCWGAFLFNCATPPVLRCQDAAAASNNVGLSAAAYRFATAGTSQTSLPGSIVVGSNSATSMAIWAAIS
jgi:hypothetical protein